MPIVIFVDSDAFVSLIKEDDSNHLAAEDIFSKLSRKKVSFVSSNYVFSEVVTVISQRVSRAASLKFIETIRAPHSDLSILWVEPFLEESALGFFRRQNFKNVSFVDCTNMAFMKRDEMDAIFSFDQVYKKNGLLLASELVSK